MSKSLPHELYAQAHAEFPGDEKAGDARYIELMKEHKYIVPRCTEWRGPLRCVLPVGHVGQHQFQGRPRCGRLFRDET